LPESIKKDLDFSTIEYCNTEFINKQLQLSQADVLFKVMIAGKEAYIYILIEHQSVVDKLMPFRLIQYMTCIWNFHIKQNDKKDVLPLPLIFPLVFFTGESSYTGMRTLWELCGDNAEAMREILQSPFHLVDVSTIPDEELTSHIWAGTLGFILRKKFKKNLYEQIKKIASNLNTIGLEKQGQYLLELFNYILNIDDSNLNADELLNIMHEELSPNVEKEIMSLAEQLIEKGEIKGKLEGEIKGKLEGELKGKLEGKLEEKIETAQILLAEGIDPAFVAKATRLPIDQVKALQKKKTD
jgi:recombination-promoting nuclease RpnB